MKKRERERFGKFDRVGHGRPDKGFGEPGSCIQFAFTVRGFEGVEREPRDDGGQVRFRRKNFSRRRLMPPKVTVLEDIFRVGTRTHHAIGERKELRPEFGELGEAIHDDILSRGGCPSLYQFGCMEATRHGGVGEHRVGADPVACERDARDGVGRRASGRSRNGGGDEHIGKIADSFGMRLPARHEAAGQGFKGLAAGFFTGCKISAEVDDRAAFRSDAGVGGLPGEVDRLFKTERKLRALRGQLAERDVEAGNARG
jgi:hypothetical protein